MGHEHDCRGYGEFTAPGGRLETDLETGLGSGKEPPPANPAPSKFQPQLFIPASANVQAGISEHAAIFPVDSIKVSQLCCSGLFFLPAEQ